MASYSGGIFLHTFDRIRIINLRSRPDRRQEVAAQLARLGLSVDGHHIAFHDACRPEHAGAFPSVGARGCFVSHLDILSDALSSGVRNVLILEDDVDFATGIESRLPDAMTTLGSLSWSIFYGGHEMVDPIAQTAPLSVADPNISTMTTHFVAFSRDAIGAAVPYLGKMMQREAGDPAGGPMHVDGAYNWLRRAHPELMTVFATPMLGYQRASRTDIHDLGLLDRLPGLRDLASVARRMKRHLIAA